MTMPHGGAVPATPKLFFDGAEFQREDITIGLPVFVESPDGSKRVAQVTAITPTDSGVTVMITFVSTVRQ